MTQMSDQKPVTLTNDYSQHDLKECQICNSNIGNKCANCSLYMCGFCYIKLKNKMDCPHCKQPLNLLNNVDKSS